jgi:hypothetical protein
MAGAQSDSSPVARLNSDTTSQAEIPENVTTGRNEKATVDSISKNPGINKGWSILQYSSEPAGMVTWHILQHHPYFGFNVPAEYPFQYVESKREWKGKELLFYFIVFLLILFALLRYTFPKYFDDLFRVFLRTTLKQRQISEQLEQTPVPSLLLNGYFVLTTGLYITFMFEHFGLASDYNFWILFLYSCIGLVVIYVLKYVGLKLTGWLFGVKEAAQSYIFIVFVINKMIGILILPFLIILSFTTGIIYTAGITMSWCLIAILFAYRIVLTFAAIRNEVKVNPFHFFIYLCAFEIAPLLLIYKALLVFLRITT